MKWVPGGSVLVHFGNVVAVSRALQDTGSSSLTALEQMMFLRLAVENMRSNSSYHD